jgi:hypothetical protein
MSCMICGKVKDFQVKVLVQTFQPVVGGSPTEFAGVCAECCDAAKNGAVMREAAESAKHLLGNLEHSAGSLGVPQCPICGCKRYYGHASCCTLKEVADKLEAALNPTSKEEVKV